MTKLERLIAKLCSNGVEYKALGEFAKISNGKDHKLLGDGDIPVYGSGGIMRYANQFIYDKQSVLIPRKGSIGNIFYLDIPFWTVDTIFYTKIDVNQIIPKFLYYFLQTQHLEDLNIAGGVPSLTKSVLDKIKIPVPPLPVQQETVRMLDKFTQLEAELEVQLSEELAARKKQYEYYRDSLLTFDKKSVIINRQQTTDNRQQTTDNRQQTYVVSLMTLGEVGRISMCKRIFKEQTNLTGDIPFYKIGTFGKKPDAYISQEVFDEYKSKYSFPKKGDVLISAAGTIGRTVIYDGEPAYYQDSNIVWIDNDESKVLNKYLFYYYSLQPWQVSSGGTIARHYNDNICKTSIPVTSLEEQARIVSILDRFDALTNDITSGLPTEITARRKQYEYYRDKLLTFKEIA
jgi:type I restriction enzyme S subunit